MAEVRCVDGSLLGVRPVPVVDRDRKPYEVTLELTCDGARFGTVGERCGYFVAVTAARLAAARTGGEDRFPPSSVEGGLRVWAAEVGLDPDRTWPELERHLPRDRDLFSFRHRDPDDVAGAGELRCAVRSEKTWIEGGDGDRGRWVIARHAVLDAWGDRGTGLRAVLTSAELAGFLSALVAEAAALGCRYDVSDQGDVMSRPAG